MQVRMVADSGNRRSFIGGSDARIIMGDDDAALIRLWREKRGEVEAEDASRTAVLSIITGGGKWVEMTIPADPLYQHLLLTAERKFWRCVENGEAPHVFGIEPPRPKIEAVRIVDMSSSNSWAECAVVFCQTRGAHAEHDAAKAELKKLMPEDAKEAVGHGIRAKRSKSGAVSFDLLQMEAGHAAL